MHHNYLDMKYQKFVELVKKHRDEEIFDMIEVICDESGEGELFEHMEHVAGIASSIAENYGINQDSLYMAGFLHDIGRLIDADEYIDILEKRDIEVSDGEKTMPFVLHGKWGINF